jgi:deazaflavin-dependent oxidoreductase (nitroreductase family)
MTDQPKLDLSLFGDEHVRQYEATDGEVGYLWNGAPCLVLTTTGARSGQERKSAQIFGADGENCVLIASKGGAPSHPDWYRNLLAKPQVRVQVKGDVFDATARVVEGPQRAQLWSQMTGIWPAYDEYQARTERRIPVVLLERVR